MMRRQQQQQGRPKRHKGGSRIGPFLRPHTDRRPLLYAAAVKYLPHDIIFNILHRLRVKPLIRFKCVSKSWRDLISSRDFVHLHLHRVKSESDNNSDDLMSMLVVARNKRCLRSSLHSIPLNRLDSTPRKICSSGDEGHWWHAIGSCDGLVCFRISDKYLVFCNPCTGEQAVEVLPEIKLVVRGTICSYAFVGYDDDDAGCRDYKVVRLIEKYQVERDVHDTCEVQVYSLRANVWKNRLIKFETKGRPPDKQRRRLCRFVPKESAIFWCTVSGMFWLKGKEKLIKYDMGSDKWSTILMPLYEHGNQITVGLEVVNDCLCLLVCNFVERFIGKGTAVEVAAYMKFDFWILDNENSSCEQKRSATWNLMFTKSEKKSHMKKPFSLSHDPVSFLRDGEKFLFKCRHEAWRFFWFDLNKKISYSACHVNHFVDDDTDPVIYVETLVSPS